jgi:hypothetical protein
VRGDHCDRIKPTRIQEPDGRYVGYPRDGDTNCYGAHHNQTRQGVAGCGHKHQSKRDTETAPLLLLQQQKVGNF